MTGLFGANFGKPQYNTINKKISPTKNHELPFDSPNLTDMSIDGSQRNEIAADEQLEFLKGIKLTNNAEIKD